MLTDPAPLLHDDVPDLREHSEAAAKSSNADFQK